ncbi:MAG: hypothetical protein PHV74_15110 [Dehalococcoidia bacterium]|nr:hypothetical protein [Dehalococcoidia bacterium]
MVNPLAFYNREISQIVLRREQRRLDFAWKNISDPPRWLTLPLEWERALAHLIETDADWTRGRHRISKRVISFVDHGVAQTGVGSTVAIVHGRTILVVGDTPAIRLIKAHFQAELRKGGFESRIPPLVGLLYVCGILLDGYFVLENAEQLVRRAISTAMDLLAARGGAEKEWQTVLGDKDLYPTLTQSDWSIFDPSEWTRRG